MNIQQSPKSIIVIFGATGDLAKRKLIPSIYKLYEKGRLSEDFAVVGVGRREWSNEEFQQRLGESIDEFASVEVAEKVATFREHFFYQAVDVTDSTSYNALNARLSELDNQFHTDGNRIFYLAMAPEFFGPIAHHLKNEGLTNTTGWKRLVIEKPFGHDLESAQTLNKQLRDAFAEEEIYRIDHYLGKEMVQNIEVIRFANALFEPLWNNRYIANIQVTSSEVVGVGDRGGYYEKSGALRDMVQNHMLQMVALLAMEPPSRLTPEEIRSEKVKVLRALRNLPDDEVPNYFVRGQYDTGVVQGQDAISYRDESRTEPNSNTETYVAGKLVIDNFRWAGVPIYIRTGKRMGIKSTKIVVQFKELPMNLYLKGEEQRPNLLVINIQPDEGVSLHLNAKKSGMSGNTTPIAMEFCNSNVNDINTPEAYEKLLYDCMHGDATNFTHWDEVALSWQFVDPIARYWNQTPEIRFPNYPSGSMGPDSAAELLEKDGFHWWPISQDGQDYY